MLKKALHGLAFKGSKPEVVRQLGFVNKRKASRYIKHGGDKFRLS